jgi:hypothetical protein
MMMFHAMDSPPTDMFRLGFFSGNSFIGSVGTGFSHHAIIITPSGEVCHSSYCYNGSQNYIAHVTSRREHPLNRAIPFVFFQGQTAKLVVCSPSTAASACPASTHLRAGNPQTPFLRSAASIGTRVVSNSSSVSRVHALETAKFCSCPLHLALLF